MAGPIRVQCSICKQLFDVPSQVVGVDSKNHQVLVQMDRSGLYGHMLECAAKHPDELPAGDVVPGASVPGVELQGRIDQFLDMRAFVSNGGSRACAMCGVKGAECMKRLGRSGRGRCRLCEDGNTHPAPGEAAGSCAVWAAENVGDLR